MQQLFENIYCTYSWNEFSYGRRGYLTEYPQEIPKEIIFFITFNGEGDGEFLDEVVDENGKYVEGQSTTEKFQTLLKNNNIFYESTEVNLSIPLRDNDKFTEKTTISDYLIEQIKQLGVYDIKEIVLTGSWTKQIKVVASSNGINSHFYQFALENNLFKKFPLN